MSTRPALAAARELAAAAARERNMTIARASTAPAPAAPIKYGLPVKVAPIGVLASAARPALRPTSAEEGVGVDGCGAIEGVGKNVMMLLSDADCDCVGVGVGDGDGDGDRVDHRDDVSDGDADAVPDSVLLEEADAVAVDTSLVVTLPLAVIDEDGVRETVELSEKEPVCDVDKEGVPLPETDGVGEVVGETECVGSSNGSRLCVRLGDAPGESVGRGVIVGDGVMLAAGLRDGVGDAVLELVGVGVRVRELVGVGDVVPVAETVAVGEDVAGALGDVDGLAPREIVAVVVVLGDAVSEIVLDAVGVGELVSLDVPLRVPVLLGVKAAL